VASCGAPGGRGRGCGGARSRPASGGRRADAGTASAAGPLGLAPVRRAACCGPVGPADVRVRCSTWNRLVGTRRARSVEQFGVAAEVVVASCGARDGRGRGCGGARSRPASGGPTRSRERWQLDRLVLPPLQRAARAGPVRPRLTARSVSRGTPPWMSRHLAPPPPGRSSDAASSSSSASHPMRLRANSEPRACRGRGRGGGAPSPPPAPGRERSIGHRLHLPFAPAPRAHEAGRRQDDQETRRPRLPWVRGETG
jgi:hypothetical protein